MPASLFREFHINWEPKIYESPNSFLVSYSFSGMTYAPDEYESGAFLMCEHFV
jgi:hypothetical protein